MSESIRSTSAAQELWLLRYYYARAFFSIAWVALALTLGRTMPGIAAVLLLIYPAWDAAANYVDASRSGGFAKNRTQQWNVWVSAAATLAVGVALTSGMHAVLAAIGAWAIASGLLQVGTAVRRWKTYGAQWAMVLSGAQSALAGGFFIAQSTTATPASIVNVAGYAGVGALYFLVSAVWLTVGRTRRARATAS